MPSHLHLLWVLQLVWGAVGVLLGVSTLMLAAGAAAIGWTTRGDEVAAGITAAAFLVCAVLLLAAGAANAWAGNALKRRQPNGRLVTLALAVPNLFVLPFGTALGIYAFWVLLHNETRARFEPPAAGSQRRSPRMADGPRRLSSTSLGTTVSGLDPNVAAALAYAVGWVSGVVLLVFEPNKFVRFHALQSTIVFGAPVARLDGRAVGAVPRLDRRHLHHPAGVRRALAAADVQGLPRRALQGAMSPATWPNRGCSARHLPSSNYQPPRHSPTPNSSSQTPNRALRHIPASCGVGNWLGNWSLGIPWKLEVGAWELSPSDTITHWPL